MTERELFDVASVRRRPTRTVFVRSVERSALVLGSTQRTEVVDIDALGRAGVELVRRRSGGGAVLLEPRRAVWMDTWLPRADPLFDDDVRRSVAWVGAWWAESLGSRDLVVHTGPPIISRWSALVCFAGLGAGEVTSRGRKVVGVAQWRGREGALTHSLAYLSVDWPAMTALLRVGPEASDAARELAASTATAAEFGLDAVALIESLVDHLPDRTSWVVESA